MVSASLSLALLVGFVVATGLAGTRLQGWVQYLDAIALLAMALIMLPMPMMGLWRSMQEVLQVAPDELDAKVHAVMDDVVPVDSRIDTETADYIRRDVSSRLDAGTPNFWLTIDFTADRRWM